MARNRGQKTGKKVCPVQRQSTNHVTAQRQGGAPWYESNLVWGSAGTAFAISLTVIAATAKNFVWLLIFAWPFATLATGAICRSTLKSTRALYATIISSLVIGSGLFSLYLYLARLPQTAQITMSPNGGPTAANDDRPHIKVDFIQPLDMNWGKRIEANVGFTNNGKRDADVLTLSDVILQEVNDSISERRAWESSYFSSQLTLDSLHPTAPKYIRPSEVLHTIPVGSSELFTTDGEILTRDLAQKIRSPKYALYFRGRILYWDHELRTKQWETRFCAYVMPGISARNLYYCLENNLAP